MSIARVNTDYLTGAADAIRRKTRSQNPIPLTQFENEIDNIPTATLTTKTITQNGTYNAQSDNADGYAVVTVDVPEKNTLDEYFEDTLEIADIPSVNELPSRFFENKKNLASVIMPNITSIGDYAFSGCTSLALTVLPDGVTSIGIYAFRGCTNLALTVLPDGVTSIGIYAFRGCTNLALTVLPDGVTSIGSGAFSDCTNLALTVLPDGVTSIGNYAFSGCTSLALTVLPDGVTSIGSSAFSDCTNLALTVLPDGVTSIGSSAFSGCTSLALTVLPDGVTIIRGSTFSGCTNLSLIVLPNGVTSISYAAFSGCVSLYSIDLTAFTDPQAIPTLVHANAFQGIPATAQFIAANQEMYDAFTTATNWSIYASNFVIEGAS